MNKKKDQIPKPTTKVELPKSPPFSGGTVKGQVPKMETPPPPPFKKV